MKPSFFSLVCAGAFMGCTTSPSGAENRIALVMGVGEYDGTGGLRPLPGIKSDLARMSTALKSVGFTVTLVENPTKTQAMEAIDKFKADIAGDDRVALFYFSGHGGEYKGKSYLIPKGAHISDPVDVDTEALAAQRVIGRMEDTSNTKDKEGKHRTNIVFLDCCRNDLSKGKEESARVDLGASGSFIGFATASEKVAQASLEGSPYTIALARHIPLIGLSITDMHTKVTNEVLKVTRTAGNEQIPYQYSGLSEVFYFVPAAGYVSPVPQPLPFSGNPVPAPTETPPPPTSPKDEAGVLAFFAKWWDHQASDEPSVWASDFTSPCDYSAPNRVRSASLPFITEDRRKMVETRYTRRLYTLLREPVYKVGRDGTTASLIVSYGYRYGGRNSAHGRAIVNMSLVRAGNRWLIIAYKEITVRGEAGESGFQNGGDVLPQGGGNNGDGEGGNPAAAAALPAFARGWWQHQFSGSAEVWAADFRSPCDYPDGHWSRERIEEDRQKLFDRYPSRTFRGRTMTPSFKMTGAATATLSMSYAYAYSGRKNASGNVTANARLSWDGDSWGITRYRETVERN